MILIKFLVVVQPPIDCSIYFADNYFNSTLKAIFFQSPNVKIRIANIDSFVKNRFCSIMNYHKIVNDVLGGTPIAVTWCPLTRSAIVFNRQIGGEILEFGVSGFLYNSNLVMYDRKFFGLWPQLWMGALTGRFSSQNLQVIPLQVSTWGDWLDNHPDTLVLSEDTGCGRDYDSDPYQSYQSSNEIRFPVNGSDGRLPQKSFVIGIRINNIAMAYSLDLIQNSTEPLEDEINGLPVLVFQGPNNTGYIMDDDGDLLPGTPLYWFAWSAFNPNTSVAD